MNIEIGTNILLLDTVKFKMITPSLLFLLTILSQAGDQFGCIPTITGAAFESYSIKGYHGKGYAWDIRTKDVKDPFGYAAWIMIELKKVSKRFRIVYGNADHTDHIHVEYRFDEAK